MFNALAPAIQKELGLSDTALGFLPTAFLFMYFAIAPLFGWLGDRGPRFKLMGIGVGLWSFATALSGRARSYASMLSARLAVGVGEASYGSISPALISDLYPREKRGRAFAIFFMAIPVGSALGYLLGGLLEAHFGWRRAFYFAGVPGLAFALWMLFLKDIPRGRYDDVADEKVPFWTSIDELRRNRSYVATVLGYAALTFVVGGVALWMPPYLTRFFHLELARANILFGGITATAGFFGTFVGGLWADRWAKRSPDAYLKLSALSAFVTGIVFIVVLGTQNLVLFMVGAFVLEFFLFLSTSPINAEIVNSVPVSYRATANAVAIFSIHILGDAISPPLMGYISDRSSLWWALWLGPVGIFVAAAFWFGKVIFAWSTLPWPQKWVLPKLQCHRGFHPEGIQENTLQAFRAAKEAGAPMIELDVHLSSDGIPVVVHDEDIKRISGREGRVAELTARELLEQAQVPTLEAVLRDRGIPNFVNVELKSNSARDHGLERAVARVVTDCRAEGRVLFSSFNPLALRRISRYLPRVPRALLASDKPEGGNAIYLRRMWLASFARPHLVHLDQDMYTPEFAAELRRRGVKVALWTVDDALRAKNFLALGAESIISPNPRLLS